MSKRLMAKVFVRSIERKCTSVCGNPSYWVSFKTHNELLTKLGASRGYTASNAQCGYTASNFVGKDCVVEYHFTAKGNLIIDTMEVQ